MEYESRNGREPMKSLTSPDTISHNWNTIPVGIFFLDCRHAVYMREQSGLISLHPVSLSYLWLKAVSEDMDPPACYAHPFNLLF